MSVTAVAGLATATFLLLSPLTTRALGTTGRGQLAAAQTALALSPALLAAGVRDAAAWSASAGHLPAYQLREVRRRLRALWLPGCVVALLAATLLAVRGGAAAVLLVLLAVGVASRTLVQSEAVVGRWTAMQDWRGLRRFLGLPALLQAVGTLVLLGTGTASSTSVTAVLIAGYAVGLWICSRDRIGGVTPDQALAQATDLRARTRAWAGGHLASAGLVRLDMIYLSLFAPASVLGLYAVASTVGLATNPVFPALQGRVLALPPTWSAFRDLHTTVVLVAALPLGLLALAGWYLLGFAFGSDFQAARLPFTILCAAAWAGLSSALSSQALGRGGNGELLSGVVLGTLLVGAGLCAVNTFLVDRQHWYWSVALVMTAVALVQAGLLLIFLHRSLCRPAAGDASGPPRPKDLAA